MRIFFCMHLRASSLASHSACFTTNSIKEATQSLDNAFLFQLFCLQPWALLWYFLIQLTYFIWQKIEDSSRTRQTWGTGRLLNRRDENCTPNFSSWGQAHFTHSTWGKQLTFRKHSNLWLALCRKVTDISILCQSDSELSSSIKILQYNYFVIRKLKRRG